ncbi:MAG: AAA family ATPase [Bacteroidetes bacterium]|jgi:predicted ATP-binding protein involved in virulence|nr:AAA family ATPase [Bacteroidota bacterium]MBT6684958.1 AAA family ATPase [Bacteroidota bacterium]MBT7144353.1 AAA family ATPase [Bacteroidota bacterium]MBT7491807.1 AAA family ATPase [Bacteroidota bacterium]
MRITDLFLKNIGPFKEAKIDFIENNIEKPPVTIITGENGTGKTIVLDAIRGLLFARYDKLERKIVRFYQDFNISANFHKPQILDGKTNYEKTEVSCQKIANGTFFIPDNMSISRVLANIEPNPDWIINYWTSMISNDSFEIKNLVAPKPEIYLRDSLNGIHRNVELTQLVCFFDYLKSSDNVEEKILGEFLFAILKKIFKHSLINGEFKYVERSTLTPIVSQNGFDVPIENLSSGNLYLVQRLVSLLGQMYSVHVLNSGKIEELCKTPGLLLIDEAENHLHPKWQKTFINSILEIFPNLQIIVTTHSPFIVSSVENARIYVCKSMQDHSIIEDMTSEYSNKPIEEILLSPVFNTSTFNIEITTLLSERKNALENGKNQKAEEIKNKLKQLNPEYFSYFDVENLLHNISK